jgi:hypothetical protein
LRLPRPRSPSKLGWFALIAQGSSHRPRFVPVYRAEAGSLRGVALAASSRPSDLTSGGRFLFSGVPGGCLPFPRRGSAKSEFLLLADVPFPRLSAVPVSSLLGRPGLFGGGFPHLRQGALTTASSQPLAKWFHGGTPILRFTAGRRFPGRSVTRAERLRPFRNSQPFWPYSQGRLALPTCYFK